MYLKMHYYEKNCDVFFSCFYNYVSKKCIARHVLFSHFRSHLLLQKIYSIAFHELYRLKQSLGKVFITTNYYCGFN